MNQQQFEQFTANLPSVEHEENFGYSFYFVGEDHRLPFVTFTNSDNEYDNVSNLSREGVFRVNIGVSRETFTSLVNSARDEAQAEDYTVLDAFLPHPDYARQNWVCILSPSGDNVEKTKQLIIEAHALAQRRYERQAKGNR